MTETTETLTPRWATPADNAALLDLVRACPMSGSIKMLFDRAPDFFTLSRLQGDGAHVCVIDEPGDAGQLAAVAAVAELPRVFIDGEVRRVNYACDLRVRPERRRGGVAKQIYGYMSDWAKDQGYDLGITTVMKGNASMTAIIQGRADVPYHYVTTMRNYGVHFLFRKRPPKGITVRPATAADVPAMVALWNRVQAGKQFAPVWDETTFLEALERQPGMAIGNYRLAFRGEKLVGLLVLWDQESFKKMVILDFAPGMRRMRRWFNPLARLLGLAPIPDVGERLPYVYATQPCAETAEDLRALYTHVYNELLGPETLFFSTMLDVNDPLTKALAGFITQQVDIELYVMDPQRKWGDHSFNRLPVYFDPALV